MRCAGIFWRIALVALLTPNVLSGCSSSPRRSDGGGAAGGAGGEVDPPLPGPGAGEGEGEAPAPHQGEGEGEPGVEPPVGEGEGEGEAPVAPPPAGEGEGEEPVDPPPAGEIGPSLSIKGGCADLVLYARAEDDKAVLLVRLHGIVARAHEAGAAQEELFDVPGGGLEIELQLGEAVGDPVCNDVLGPDWRLDHTIGATAGRLHIVVTPDPNGEFARATAELQAVEFIHPETEERLTVEEIRWSEVFVGWLPG